MTEKTVQSPSIKDVPASKWEKLAQKKIYFGHQSVGFNIIEGVKDLMKEYPYIKLSIVKTSNPSEFNKPLFAHSSVGKNRDPKSKIDAFDRFMEKGIGGNVDISFFKFCFVDITAKTNVEGVFAEYKSTMSRLKKKYPKTTIVHVTVPLTAKLTGTKGLIRKTKDLVKKIMGRPVFDYYDNIKRNQLNNMFRKEYGGKEPIFDLAAVESTFPNGKRKIYEKSGTTFYTLIEEYTYDGGHLNALGSKVAAEQLLIFLANLSK